MTNRQRRTCSDIIAALSRVTAIDPTLIGDTIATLEADNVELDALRRRIHHLNEHALELRHQLDNR